MFKRRITDVNTTFCEQNVIYTSNGNHSHLFFYLINRVYMTFTVVTNIGRPRVLYIDNTGSLPKTLTTHISSLRLTVSFSFLISLFSHHLRSFLSSLLLTVSLQLSSNFLQTISFLLLKSFLTVVRYFY